ncbi:hypothetical protein D3C72_2117750 [compost metagenome]
MVPPLWSTCQVPAWLPVPPWVMVVTLPSPKSCSASARFSESPWVMLMVLATWLSWKVIAAL